MSLTPAFRYISAAELAAIIKANPAGVGKTWAVIDVRDSDFVGGNIVGAANHPTDTFIEQLPKLVKTYADVPKVVFHCALSQIRGPKAARRYAEARRLLLDMEDEEEENRDAPKQEIFVLRGGFAGFQQKYRDDKELVEKFNKFYHD